MLHVALAYQCSPIQVNAAVGANNILPLLSFMLGCGYSPLRWLYLHIASVLPSEYFKITPSRPSEDVQALTVSFPFPTGLQTTRMREGRVMPGMSGTPSTSTLPYVTRHRSSSANDR